MRILVIGSGVAGASTAYALARSGAGVTVVDADARGRATAAGAGIIQPWSVRDDGEFYELYAAGAAYYPELLAHLAEDGIADIGFKRTGALIVNEDPALLDAVEARLAARRASAPQMGEVSRIDERVARSLFPPLAEGMPAVRISGAARVDGRMLQAGLLAAAQRHGARIEQRTFAFENAPDSAVREADAIVVATGAWTNDVLAPLGLRVDVEPQRGQITHLRLDGVDTSAWPVLEPLASHYLLAFDDSRVVVGATRETGSGFDARVTAAGQREVLANALSVAPGLADATVIETRVGLRPLPGGRMPSVGLIGEASGVPLYVNAGFGAAGLTMGPYVGAALAAEILGAS